MSVGNLPTSIDQFFEIEFTYVFESCRSNAFKRATILFEIIIAGMTPLNKNELWEISTYYRARKKKNKSFESVFQDMVTTFDQYYLQKGIIKLKPFLQDWMISLSITHPCKVDIMKGHAAISRFMISNIDVKKVNVSHDFIVELFMHMQRSEKEKLKLDMLNPLSTYVDKTICGHNLYGMRYEPCHSVLDMFASVVDSFRLMKKMISFSKTTNKTLSAINALLMNNTNSFIAILEKSSIDFSCFTNMNILKTSVNNIYQNNGFDILSDDYVTILHIEIIQRNHRAFKLIFEKEKGTLEQKTASGYTAIYLAVKYDNLETFKFLTRNSTIGPGWLHFTAYMRAYAIFNNLLDNGIHDMCINCMSFQYNKAFKNFEFRISMYANKEYHKLLTEFTCESTLNYATRVGDQVIVESILRVSNETVECRDFHGLTPLAGAIVFQHPQIFKFLIDRGASLEFRCKPVDVYERTMQMQSIDVYKELYTEIMFRPLGSEYCPYGRSFGYLSLRWPSCEIMRTLQRKYISRNVLFDIDINFKTPLYFLICESALHSPFSCKMFLFLLFLFQKPVNQNQIDVIVDSCHSPDIDIHLVSYSFSYLISSVICTEPRVQFRTILNFYLKVHIGDIQQNTGPFINLLDHKRPKRQIYNGIELPGLFPVKPDSFKEIEMYHKETSSTKHLNPFFSIGILNKTITASSRV